MLKVGITGGIGSGKTTVCRVFSALGIPVLYADEVARQLMNEDEQLRAAIKGLLGEDAYNETGLDRSKVAAAVFRQPETLTALNALVHPVTIAHGEAWMRAQLSPYVLKEAAIFFETGSNKTMDLMIGVDAPEALRIRRAALRSGIAEAQARAVAARQMNNDEKMLRCDFVITNDDRQAVLPQVLRLHRLLLEKAGR